MPSKKVLACLFVALVSVTTSIGAENPNIVVIFADDLGYGDVSCYGATHVRTPNIDRLAAEGRRFTDAHSASAVCTPSRYALMTGSYPVRRENLWGPVFLRSPLVLSPDQLTLPKVAREAGYATACIGKWHLGFGDRSPTDWNQPLKPGPLECGFDYYFGVPVVNSHPPFVYVENYSVLGLTQDDPFVYGEEASTKVFDEKMGINQIGGAKAAHMLYDDEKVGAMLTRKAVDWIHTHKDQRFFLYFPTTNIHHPFTPAPRFLGTSKAERYGDFIHELDWIVGEVMNALDEAGITENTLVIFTSDNGGMLNRGGQAAWQTGHRLNGELLGFKFDAWEGGHRVPFIARWPGRIPAGSQSDALVSNVDLLGTVAALLGRDLLPGEAPDSFNLLPLLTKSSPDEVRDHLVIAPSSRRHLSFRKGDWIFISGQGGGGFTAKNIGDHGLGGPAAHLLTRQINSDIENGQIKKSAPKAQLYNLAKDPYQRTNVIHQHPDLANAMKAELKLLVESNGTRPH